MAEPGASEKISAASEHDAHVAPSMDHQLDEQNTELDLSAIGGTLQDLPKGYYYSPSFLGTVAALSLASCSAYIGSGFAVNVITQINEDIGPDPSYVWIALVWTLSAAVSYTLLGRLSDIFGRRWFFIGGNVLGFIGTLMGGSAKEIKTLIGANCLIGIAGAVQLSFTFVIGELVPNKHRAYANGVLYCASTPFAVFGPVIARTFILHTSAGWRWCFYLNTITTGLAIILFYFCYHPPTFEMLHTTRTKKSVFRMIDIVGVVLFTSGLVLFLLGISWGGTQYPWKSGHVIGFIVGGAVLLIIFIFYEIYMPVEYSLIPMRLFRNRGYVGTILTASVGSMIYYSMAVLWPMLIGDLYTTNILEVGWMSCAVGGATLLGQLIAAVLCKAIGHHKWQMVVAAICMTAFVGGMAAATQHTRSLAVAMIIMGSIPVGYIELMALTTAPLCLDADDIGLASGVLGSTRSALATVATSVYVAILSNKQATNIPKYVGPAAISAGLPQSSVPALLSALQSNNFTSVVDVTPQIISAAGAALQEADSKSFQVVFLSSLAFGGCAIIAALNTPNLEDKFNNEVAKRLHGKDIQKREISKMA